MPVASRSRPARPPSARILRPASRRRAPSLSYDEGVTDAGSLRVGHGEREQLVHVLMQQYAEGRLTPSELDDLSRRARQARTYADLDRLVVDLPVPPPSAGVRQTATTANLARLGTDAEHRQTLTGGMSSYVRRGVWTVPAYLNLNAGMATVKLDFQQAICPHEVVDIQVSAGVGAVVLVVPDGWGVNTDQIGKGIGSVSNKVDTIPQAGKPLLVLHGSSVAGAVEVRYPEPSRPLPDAPKRQAAQGRQLVELSGRDGHGAGARRFDERHAAGRAVVGRDRPPQLTVTRAGGPPARRR